MSDYAISVKNISKKFKLYHEKRDSIFEVATSFFQKKRPPCETTPPLQRQTPGRDGPHPQFPRWQAGRSPSRQR